MKLLTWRPSIKGRPRGLAMMLLGAIVLLLPIFVGEWVISILGIVLVGAGLMQFIEILRSRDKTNTLISYIAGAVTILLGLVLFASPDLALSGVLVLVTLFFLIDGVTKFYAAFKQTGHDRRWSIFNGLFTIVLGLAIWYLISAKVGAVAISVALGFRLLMLGWTMLLAPVSATQGAEAKPDARQHPDPKLKLEPSDAIREMQEPIAEKLRLARDQHRIRCLTTLGIFFAIHALRTDAKWNFVGLISPFSAVVGDAVVALTLAVVLILPLRLFWRKLSRPLERTAWNRFYRLHEQGADPTLGEKVLHYWLSVRMKLALEMRELRQSLGYGFWQVLRIGLPLTAILVAVNSIWGFSWYFNSENWASGVWQRITQVRVDTWRQRMADEVKTAALARGIAPDKIFAVEPEGLTADGDFSFIVIGDTGEGDPSQMALRDQLIAAGQRDQVKFLVLSSDVIYPDGKMKDYETNFYLPFKGFAKPIYAIPGNHDWFDANEGFNANFLDRESAGLALRARLAVDLKTTVITTNQRFDEITAEAQRLRQYYGIKNGLQRGPFFEVQTPGFSLIAVDTGILRTLDQTERAWLEGALTRSGNNFKMVVLGHPFYVAGIYSAAPDSAFNDLHETLKRFQVDVVMAGDTHDFEFYKVKSAAGASPAETLHFVNGGGGAYLSIGTAVAFPAQPVTPDYAFYPRTDELTAKVRNEPAWKMPFLFWLKFLGGYPFDSEMVSGAFDFNRAPFFQSFVEVSVERSQKRVRFLLYGVNGQLRWRDIQVGGQVKPPDKSDDDFVEFIAPLKN